MKNINRLTIIIISLSIIICLTFGFIGITRKNHGKENLINISYSEKGIPKFIDGSYTNKKVTNSKEALKSLNELKMQMKFKNAEEEFSLLTEETISNITYYKFKQIFKEIPVFNHNLIISTDSNGNILSLSGYYLPDIELDVVPKIPKEKAEQNVKNILGDQTKIQETVLNIIDLDNKIKLVYIIKAYNENEYKEFIVDANNGEIIINTELLESASYEYTGEGLKGKETILIEEYQELMPFKIRYRFNDLNRKIEIKDGRTIGTDSLSQLLGGIFTPKSITGDIENGVFKISVGNNTKEEIVKDAITTMKNYEDIYDYYKNVLNRNSYDNKGSKIIVHIGVGTISKDELNNAFWLSGLNQMFIGRTKEQESLSQAKDILGHEFTHGVISKTAAFAKVPKNKNEPNETSALNEGIADILGSLIEGKNWTIGEDVNWIIRNLEKPSKTSNPSKKGDMYWYPYIEVGTLEDFLKFNDLETLYDRDNGGEHKNSTVVGHAAYLMEKNKAVANKDQLAKLWYNSLFLMSSYSNFEDCALAVIKTAKNMGMRESSIEKIKEAFYETNMLEKTKYKINGNITNEKKRLPNIKINLRNEQTGKLYTIKTDHKGEFEFKDLPRGKYLIIIDNEKYRSYKKTIEITNKDKEEIIKLEKVNTEEEIQDEITSNDECLEYKIENDEVIITDYKYNCPSDLKIPSKIEGYPVTKIEAEAYHIKIESLDLPDTLKEITDHAFTNQNIKKLVLPDSLTFIGEFAFRDCEIEELTIGKGLKTIEDYTFQHNKIKKLIIPNNIKEIKYAAFSHNEIEELVLGEGLETINGFGFDSNNLSTLIIPENIKEIGTQGFYQNPLTNIVLKSKNLKLSDAVFSYYGEERPRKVVVKNDTGKSFDWYNQLGLLVADCYSSKDNKCNFEKGTINAKGHQIDKETGNVHKYKIIIE